MAGRLFFLVRASAVALLVLALLVGLGTVAWAKPDPDPWLGRDKALHFSVSAGIAAAGYAGASLFTDDRRWRLAVSAGLGIAAGAGKEIDDRYTGGDASWRDLTWDLIGTATGVGLAWLVDRLVDRLDTRPVTHPVAAPDDGTHRLASKTSHSGW